MIRRIVLPLLATALVLGLAGGAAWHTQRTVDAAERALAPDPGLDRIPELDRSLEQNTGFGHTELSATLLPVPSGYVLGPDIDGYGNDGELSGEEAAAQLMDAAAGWPRDYRDELEDLLDSADLQGIALRSYARTRGDLVVSLTLTRYGAAGAAEDSHRTLAQSLSEDELFRAGPELKGYPDAACAHPPRGEDWLRFVGLDPEDFTDDADAELLDRMVCSAATGPYHLLAEVQGIDPLRADAATQLFQDQLDRIESPGMAV